VTRTAFAARGLQHAIRPVRHHVIPTTTQVPLAVGRVKAGHDAVEMGIPGIG
jgi:hypothetical protein